MSRLERLDWENLKKSAEANLKQLEISIIQLEELFKIAEVKIKELDAVSEKELGQIINDNPPTA